MKKKMMSLALALVMCMGLSVPAFAKDTIFESSEIGMSNILNSSGEKYTQAQIGNVEHDLESFANVGISPESLSIASVCSDGQFIYEYTYPDEQTSALLTISQDTLQNSTMTINENGTCDILVFSNDGSLYVNGGKVEISQESDMKLPNLSSDLLRMGNVEYSTGPFMGQATDYNSNITIVQKAEVSTGGSLLKDLTHMAIVEILAYALGVPEFGVLENLLYTMASNLKSAAEINAPDSAYLSYRGNRYEHDTQSMPTNRYYRYAINYYAHRYYSTWVDAAVFYEHNYFS